MPPGSWVSHNFVVSGDTADQHDLSGGGGIELGGFKEGTCPAGVGGISVGDDDCNTYVLTGNEPVRSNLHEPYCGCGRCCFVWWLWFGAASPGAGGDDVSKRGAVGFTDLYPDRGAVLIGDLVHDAPEIASHAGGCGRFGIERCPVNRDGERPVWFDAHEHQWESHRWLVLLPVGAGFVAAHHAPPPSVLGFSGADDSSPLI